MRSFGQIHQNLFGNWAQSAPPDPLAAFMGYTFKVVKSWLSFEVLAVAWSASLERFVSSSFY